MIRQLFDAESYTYSYLVADERSAEAALIDPVREQFERDLLLLKELGLSLRYVLETHVHADHVTAAAMFADATHAKTVASNLGAGCATEQLVDGDVVRVGSLEIRALATPGHTRDSLSFYLPGHVFTGDALLVRGTGRTDFQSGDAGALYDSITRKLFTLPDDTRVWPAHDYRGHSVSTIGEEKRFNPRLAGKTRDEFIAILGRLELPPPRKMAVAVPANLVCGRDSAL